MPAPVYGLSISLDAEADKVFFPEDPIRGKVCLTVNGGRSLYKANSLFLKFIGFIYHKQSASDTIQDALKHLDNPSRCRVLFQYTDLLWGTAASHQITPSNVASNVNGAAALPPNVDMLKFQSAPMDMTAPEGPRFPFDYRLVDSVTGEYLRDFPTPLEDKQVIIAYILLSDLRRPFPHKNQTAMVRLNVMDGNSCSMPLYVQPQTQRHSLQPPVSKRATKANPKPPYGGPMGQIEIEFSLLRSGFCKGETLTLHMNASHNAMQGKSVTGLRISLIGRYAVPPPNARFASKTKSVPMAVQREWIVMTKHWPLLIRPGDTDFNHDFQISLLASDSALPLGTELAKLVTEPSEVIPLSCSGAAFTVEYQVVVQLLVGGDGFTMDTCRMLQKGPPQGEVWDQNLSSIDQCYMVGPVQNGAGELPARCEQLRHLPPTAKPGMPISGFSEVYGAIQSAKSSGVFSKNIRSQLLTFTFPIGVLSRLGNVGTDPADVQDPASQLNGSWRQLPSNSHPQDGQMAQVGLYMQQTAGFDHSSGLSKSAKPTGRVVEGTLGDSEWVTDASGQVWRVGSEPPSLAADPSSEMAPTHPASYHPHMFVSQPNVMTPGYGIAQHRYHHPHHPYGYVYGPPGMSHSTSTSSIVSGPAGVLLAANAMGAPTPGGGYDVTASDWTWDPTYHCFVSKSTGWCWTHEHGFFFVDRDTHLRIAWDPATGRTTPLPTASIAPLPNSRIAEPHQTRSDGPQQQPSVAPPSISVLKDIQRQVTMQQSPLNQSPLTAQLPPLQLTTMSAADAGASSAVSSPATSASPLASSVVSVSDAGPSPTGRFDNTANGIEGGADLSSDVISPASSKFSSLQTPASHTAPPDTPVTGPSPANSLVAGSRFPQRRESAQLSDALNSPAGSPSLDHTPELGKLALASSHVIPTPPREDDNPPAINSTTRGQPRKLIKEKCVASESSSSSLARMMTSESVSSVATELASLHEDMEAVPFALHSRSTASTSTGTTQRAPAGRQNSAGCYPAHLIV
ncbi:hypothetical protein CAUPRSCDRAFT_10895 [Caulochytrium protostelioides]|uniref:Uncharacterized protein n=1 Tax=Caulochytrium protostelioides TaxID=1555241 RepID=A0A4P9WVK4_9FUNG|nr:hypothetical protein CAUPRSCDRAFT_10895 [Caulochytrium protostelioides]